MRVAFAMLCSWCVSLFVHGVAGATVQQLQVLVVGRRVVSAKDRDCLCEGQTEVEVTGSLHSQPP